MVHTLEFGRKDCTLNTSHFELFDYWLVYIGIIILPASINQANILYEFLASYVLLVSCQASMALQLVRYLRDM